MENFEELKTAFKELTKYVNSVFIVLLVISLYVIQRSYVSLPLAEDVTSEFVDKTAKTQMQGQVTASGLSFTYGSMNFFWPIVIFILYFVLYYLLLKQTKIWDLLINTKETKVSTLFDSINLYHEIQSNLLGRTLMKISCFIPLIALLFHGISGCYICYTISCQQIGDIVSQDILIWQFYLQIFVTLISFILSIMMPFRIKNKLIKYR